MITVDMVCPQQHQNPPLDLGSLISAKCHILRLIVDAFVISFDVTLQVNCEKAFIASSGLPSLIWSINYGDDV